MFIANVVHLPLLTSSPNADVCTPQEHEAANLRGQGRRDRDEFCCGVEPGEWEKIWETCVQLHVGERDEAKQRHVLSLEEWSWITGVYAKNKRSEVADEDDAPFGIHTPLGSVRPLVPLREERLLPGLGDLDTERVFDRARLSAEDPSDFVLRFHVYSYWRQRQWIVKSGLKFGADYLLYEQPPEVSHARYALFILRPWQSTRWRDINGLVRLAVGVAKKLIVAVPIWTSSRDNITSVGEDRCDLAEEVLFDAGQKFRETLKGASLQESLQLRIRFLKLSRGGALR